MQLTLQSLILSKNIPSAYQHCMLKYFKMQEKVPPWFMRSKSETPDFKAVVNRKYPRISAFHHFNQTVTYYLKIKNIYAVQCQYQLRASIRPLKPLPADRADKAGRKVPQLDQEAPLKVRACRGT